MARKEEIMVDRRIPLEKIQFRIRSIEKDVRTLKRLYFIKCRYQGSSVTEASKNVGVTKMVGYYWQESWNREGFSGLTPRLAGGKPSRLSEEQKVELKSILEKRDDWMAEEVRKMIKEKFNMEYGKKHVSKMLNKMGMHYSKPYQHDYRRPGNAEDFLKIGDLDVDHEIIGFLDETSLQTTSSTARMWSFLRSTKYKKKDSYKANAFGFYSLNGKSAVDFHDNSRKEDIIDFLSLIRRSNPDGRIVAIIDNFKPHHSPETLMRAAKLKIYLVYLPSYSPDLNPIEFIWKSLKRQISNTFIASEMHIKHIVQVMFYT